MTYAGFTTPYGDQDGNALRRSDGGQWYGNFF